MDCHFVGILAKISRLGPFTPLIRDRLQISWGGTSWVAFRKYCPSIYPNIGNPCSILVWLLKSGMVLYGSWVEQHYVGKKTVFSRPLRCNLRCSAGKQDNL